jgi:hypothetical protein
MLLRQRVKTGAHVIELLNFVRIAFEGMEYAAFLKA